MHQFSGFRDRGLSAPQSAHVRQLFIWGREGSGVLDFYERRMQLIDIQQMVNYGGSGPEDFRLELPSAAVTCELNGGLGSALELLMTIELA